MKLATTLVPLILAHGFIATPAVAGSNGNAKLLLQIEESLPPDACFQNTTIPECYHPAVESNRIGPPSWVYVLVERSDLNGAGVAGAHFGVSYDPSLFVFTFNLCADQSTPVHGWPNSGGGLTVTWNPGNCQTRVTTDASGIVDPTWDGIGAVVGYFYMAAYGPGQMELTEHPIDLTASITDCAAATDVISGQLPSRLGKVGFNEAGYDPCGLLDHERCYIVGPDTCEVGDTVYYSAVNGYDWFIAGNGTIVGPTSTYNVQVQAGGPGTFTIASGSTGPGGLPPYYNCAKIVTVLDPTPVETTTWSGLKTLFR